MQSFSGLPGGTRSGRPSPRRALAPRGAPHLVLHGVVDRTDQGDAALHHATPAVKAGKECNVALRAVQRVDQPAARLDVPQKLVCRDAVLFTDQYVVRKTPLQDRLGRIRAS